MWYTDNKLIKDDYLYDGYNWTYNGSNKPQPKDDPLIVSTFYIAKTNEPVPEGSEPFKKKVSKLLDLTMPYLIIYSGDHEYYKPSCHGNATYKATQQTPFRPTKPSVKNKIKSTMANANPASSYKSWPGQYSNKPR